MKFYLMKIIALSFKEIIKFSPSFNMSNNLIRILRNVQNVELSCYYLNLKIIVKLFKIITSDAHVYLAVN